MKRRCNNCGREYDADERNLKRGWGLCCNKSCAAKLREKRKPSYNPITVMNNNFKRECYSMMKEEEGYPLSYDGADDDQWGDCEFGIHE